jgi:hypothetical protein
MAILCVEFKPQGAYRFFEGSLSGFTDGIFDAHSLFNLPGWELQERSQLHDLDGKVLLLQQFLLQRFAALDKSDQITCPLKQFLQGVRIVRLDTQTYV